MNNENKTLDFLAARREKHGYSMSPYNAINTTMINLFNTYGKEFVLEAIRQQEEYLANIAEFETVALELDNREKVD